VIQLVLHLHECADPAPAESAVAIDPAPTETVATDSAAEPLHSVADYVVDFVATGAALTETS
jgi:hypothetical protein